MTDLAALVVRMQADNSEYIKALDQATGKLNKFAHDQESLVHQIGDKFSEFAAEFAAAFTIDKLAEFTAQAIESAASLEKLSQSSGISVESLSSLRLAAAASGISQEELGTSLKKLNVNLSEAAGNATSKAAIAFKGLGIAVTDSNGKARDAGAVFGDLAQRFSQMEDGPNKVAYAIALLGKAGQQLIPTLNQGAAGLAELKAQAAAAGITITSETAEAAEALERKVNILKATMIDGFGVQLSSVLVPALTSLATSLLDAGKNGEALSNFASGIGIVVKLAASFFIQAADAVERLGTAIGAVSASAVAAAKLHFTEAGAIWKQGADANIANRKWEAATLKAMWEAGEADELAIISDTEVQKLRLKMPGHNLAADEESSKADEKLKALAASTKAQAEAFGLGGAAALQFKLHIGDLAKDLGLAGEEGQKAAAAAVHWAGVLEEKKDTKAIVDYTQSLVKQVTALDMGALAAENYALHTGALGLALDGVGKKADGYRESIMKAKAILVDEQDQKAVQALADKADVLAGRLNKAALAAFDLQNQMLKKNLEASSSPDAAAGLQVLANEREHVNALSKIQELNLQAAQINSVIAEQESTIALARSAGQITEIDAMNQLATLRAKQISDLSAIQASEQGIAAAANDPTMADGVRKFGMQIDALKVQMNQFDSQVRIGLEGAFAHNFADLINGAKSFKQAILGFLQDIDKQFVDMIAKQYAQKLFAAPGADGSGGGAMGGLAGLLGGLLGGGGGAATSISATGAAAAGTDTGALASTIMPFAAGGSLGAGKVGLVGEAGPEYVYSGSQNMNVVPAGTGGGKQVSVTNHFTIQAPGGTISRASQMQTAAAAARSLSQANRRNNT